MNNFINQLLFIAGITLQMFTGFPYQRTDTSWKKGKSIPKGIFKKFY